MGPLSTAVSEAAPTSLNYNQFMVARSGHTSISRRAQYSSWCTPAEYLTADRHAPSLLHTWLSSRGPSCPNLLPRAPRRGRRRSCRCAAGGLPKLTPTPRPTRKIRRHPTSSGRPILRRRGGSPRDGSQRQRYFGLPVGVDMPEFYDLPSRTRSTLVSPRADSSRIRAKEFLAPTRPSSRDRSPRTTPRRGSGCLSTLRRMKCGTLDGRQGSDHSSRWNRTVRDYCRARPLSSRAQDGHAPVAGRQADRVVAGRLATARCATDAGGAR